jgi:hypothetical protein
MTALVVLTGALEMNEVTGDYSAERRSSRAPAHAELSATRIGNDAC